MAKVLDHNAAYAKDPNGSQRELEVDASGNLKTVSTGGGSGDGAILDGVSSSIKATVKDYTNSNPQSVELVDTNGDPYSAGGGTQYAEDTPHVSGDLVNLAGVVQKAADAGLSSDGDRSVMQVDSNGWLKTNVKNALVASPLFVRLSEGAAALIGQKTMAGSLPVTLASDQGPVRVDGANPGVGVGLPVNDNASSLTVDAPVTEPLGVRISDGAAALIGQKVMANSLPVVLASDESVLITQDNADLVDNNLFSDGASRVIPVGFYFDNVAGTALTENDIAAARIDSKRAVQVVVEDANTRGQGMGVDGAGRVTVNQGNASISAWLVNPTSQAARDNGLIRIWDGTDTALVSAGGELSVVLATLPGVGGDVAHDSVDSGNPVKMGGKVIAAAGTPAFVSAAGDRANASLDGAGRQIVAEAVVWTVTHAPAANTQAVASKAAGAAGVKHILEWIHVSSWNSGAATAAVQLVNVRDGATGAGTILMTLRLPVAATTLTEVNKFLNDLHIVGTAATAMTVEFSAAGGANNNQVVTIGGYDTL